MAASASSPSPKRHQRQMEEGTKQKQAYGSTCLQRHCPLIASVKP
jgi:hypothetical protein